ncbi:hypothetical protein JOC78_002270 [Bacillus ectoiniformans]|uniref:hypothetical protein n=1 Tax=Bacillus ectoiniformans TaxID=1494429 RepID=UPI001959DF07|nr:hypothetical protein [Bacillus ectoiniformans]MBM7649317.1 hypothetical protein [Bacillus ectoiniformans]
MQRIQPLKGLLRPKDAFYQLEHAETIRGLWKPLFVLTLLSIIIYTSGAWLGIGSEAISSQLPNVTASQFEWMKALFTIGNAIWGLLFALFVIFIPSLLFWVLLDVEYFKTLGLQTWVLSIYLIEAAILVPLSILWGLDRPSSPFGLGPLSQYVTNKELIVKFFGFISIFQIWAAVMQYQFLKRISPKNKGFILLIVVSISIIWWMFGALASSIHINRIF